MEVSKVLMVVAIVAVGIAIINLGIGIFQTNKIRNVLLSPDATGTAEVQIVSAVHVRFNPPFTSLDWGSGAPSGNPAYLHSLPDVTGNYDFVNWSATDGDNATTNGLTGGLEIQNYGNVDVDLYLITNRNATDFICHDGTSVDATCAGEVYPAYANVTWMLEEKLSGACSADWQNGTEWTMWTGINSTTPGSGTLICSRFNSTGGSNEIELDLNLTIPISAPPGERSGGNDLEITATAEEST